VIANVINKILKKDELRNFYYSHYTSKFQTADANYVWSSNIDTSGCIKLGSLSGEVLKVGPTTDTGLTRQTGTSGWHLENNYIDIISET
jgi:hypothetical protein